MTTIAEKKPRAAIESRRVSEELNTPQQREIRFRAVREMQFGEHWIWRNGAEHYTAAGMRLLADAFSREGDTPAALVCRKHAERLAGEDAAPAVNPRRPSEPDYYAEMEKRGLA